MRYKNEVVQGRLENIERLKGSYFGNPRYRVEINGEYFATGIDCSFGYAVTNYRDEEVIATIRRLKNRNVIIGAKTVKP